MIGIGSPAANGLAKNVYAVSCRALCEFRGQLMLVYLLCDVSHGGHACLQAESRRETNHDTI
jgi:hypothetical protein